MDVLADLLGPRSNHLTEMLMEWNAVLQHSSLGCGQAQNTNERKDERATRDGHPAVGRRRKTAEEGTGMAKRPAPFSLRLTFEQRARLERDAGDMSLSAYIQSRLFDTENPAPRRRAKRPVKDHQALAQVLGLLGQSRLSSNLNQLARSANTGSLPVTPDTEAALINAATDVQEIRRMLIEALNLEVEP